MFTDAPWGILTLVTAIAGSVWSLAWWLNGHFNNLRRDFLLLSKEIVSKLEYHERHDDTRFSQIRDSILQVRDDVWSIRVQDAARDGKLIKKEQ
jgi:hypothetical protein